LQYETEKKRSDEVNNMRKRLDELKAKAEEAERRYDLATASDIRYYAIPEIQARIDKAQAEEAAHGGSIADTVTPEAIAEVVARWTGIPVTRLLSTEKEKLLKLEKTLAEQVVGQPEAVKAVANAIRLSRSGLRNENRPLASFLFAGPSGTGKTLLSKTVSIPSLAEVLPSILTLFTASTDPFRLTRRHVPHRWQRILRKAFHL
jgi:ATP-dependent Clp protease ATP-binding subunit ClpB